MTNDKELVEVWRKEYFDLTGELSGYSAKWAGFVLAKRAQPSVVLPNPISVDSYLHGKAYVIDEVHAALTAAGIKYTIGE